MQTGDARRILFALWIGIMGIQVANQVMYAWQLGTPPAGSKAPAPKQCTTDYLVPPHKFIAAAFVYTVLFGLAEWAPSLAVAFGAGVDLAALLGPSVAGTSGANSNSNTLFDKLASFVKASA